MSDKNYIYVDSIPVSTQIKKTNNSGGKLITIFIIFAVFFIPLFRGAEDKPEVLEIKPDVNLEVINVEPVKEDSIILLDVTVPKSEHVPEPEPKKTDTPKTKNHYSKFKEMQYVVDNYQSNSNAMIIYNRFKELGHQTAMQMVGICYAESGWQSKRANGANFDGSFDWGICQVNDKYHCPKALKINPNKYCYETLLDPVANAEISYQIYKGRGNFNAWYARYRFGYYIDRVEF